MEAFALYLGKSAAWLTGFTLVYLLFLRNERFFILKRVYLITGMVVSVLFPLISFHYSVELPAVADLIPEQVFTPDRSEGSQQVQQAIQGHPWKINYWMILFSLYLLGIILFVLRIIKQAKSLLNKINKTNVNDLGYAKLVRASEFSGSFSFFNYVFINPSLNEIEMEPVMKHELVHVRQKHWLDLILVEILCLLQWVNPLTWIYSRFVRLNHEYIADQVALQSSSDPAVYKAVLLNQMFSSPVISLSNSFNYSINKTRFDMMKKIIISPWRRLKVLFVLPVFAVVFYAFATPEYRYVSADNNSVEPLTIYEPSMIVQNQVKGIVLNERDQPVEGVAISSTGSNGNTYHMMTHADGRFSINNVKENASLLFFNVAYKRLILKPDFTSDMEVKLEKDPDYSPPVINPSSPRADISSQKDITSISAQKPEPIVVIDGEVTDLKLREVVKHLGYNMGTTRMIRGQEAIDKYGEKGANGVIEVTTRKKALEMGLKPPFPRLAPDDYPTFQGKPHTEFRKWVLDQLKYPDEATNKKIEGWVSVNFQVNLDGTVTNAQTNFKDDPILTSALINIVKSSPVWDPPKNPDVDEPYRTGFTVRFILPDQISREDPPFVVVEEMPIYPGGDKAVLDFIKVNLKYPEKAKADSIEGRVILRFIITTEGNVEGISVLKGVHPLLDAEAMRVVGTLTGFNPGRQGGKAVSVWYMVPVNFSLSQEDLPPKQ